MATRRRAGPKDQFLNFLDLTSKFNAADSSNIEETTWNTGLSIRAGLAFLIHQLEVIFQPFDASNEQILMLATETGKTSLGLTHYGDRGVMCMARSRWRVYTQGGGALNQPHVLRWLPPFPIAAPQIVTYLQTSLDEAGLRGQPVGIRLGYTTTEVDGAMYAEIAETWGY